MSIVGLANVLPSSTAPSPGDRAASDATTVDILHDLGGLSMMSSGAQDAGGIGHVVARTWQTADRMKRRRGPLPGDGANADNTRAKRYIAKYTINPAIAHGVADHVGSVEIGKLADLVLWSPAFFGVKPDIVLKAGNIVGASILDVGVSRGQPSRYRAMFGAFGGARVGACLTFVSRLALDKGIGQRLRTQRRLVAVKNTRGTIGKHSMVFNETTPLLCADPETGQVEAEGAPGAPAEVPPLAQRYFLY